MMLDENHLHSWKLGDHGIKDAILSFFNGRQTFISNEVSSSGVFISQSKLWDR